MYGNVSKAIDFGTGIVAEEAADETAWQEDELPASMVGIWSGWSACISPSESCGSTLDSRCRRYRDRTVALVKKSSGAAQTQSPSPLPTSMWGPHGQRRLDMSNTQYLRSLC